MTITWGAFKSQVVYGLMSNAVNDQTFDQLMSGTTRTGTLTDAQALIWCGWALQELSNHTADTANAAFNGDGNTTVFTIKDPVIDTLEKTALVLLSEVTGKVNVLPPYRFQEDTIFDPTRANKFFWEWPINTLNLGFVMAPKQQLRISYYKTWDTPVADSSIMSIPRWMEVPLAYNIARLATEAFTLEYSKIRQWNVKTDSGTPEDNPLFLQLKYFREEIDRMMAKQPVQDRNRFFTFAGRENNGR